MPFGALSGGHDGRSTLLVPPQRAASKRQSPGYAGTAVARSGVVLDKMARWELSRAPEATRQKERLTSLHRP